MTRLERRLAAADHFWEAMGPTALAQWLAVRDQAAERLKELDRSDSHTS